MNIKYNIIYILFIILASAFITRADTTDEKPKLEKLNVYYPEKGVVPNTDFSIILEFILNKGSHTYWVNPGDSGMPPAIDFKIPPVVTIQSIRYQNPSANGDSDVIDYGYTDTMRAIARFSLIEGYKGIDIPISINASILVCKDICVPAKANKKIAVPISKEGDIDFLKKITEVEEFFPSDDYLEGVAIEKGGKTELYISDLRNFEKGKIEKLRFYPIETSLFKPLLVDDITVLEQKVVFKMDKSMYFESYPETIKGVLVSDTPFYDGRIKRNAIMCKITAPK
ncbi:MAG: hypothetical protein Kapaf2KO_18990 [Candidatus Kapaibacteriales bacterium]